MQPVLYREYGRGYASTAVLAVCFAAGLGIDFALGGGDSHWIAWLVAAALVIGADLIMIAAARQMRTLTVSPSYVSVGEARIARNEIMAFDHVHDEDAQILGRPRGMGLPRGTAALQLVLTDGRRVVVATRHPGRLASFLEISSNLPEVRPAEPADAPAIDEITRRAPTLYSVAGIELPGPWITIGELHDSLAVLVSGRPASGAVRLGDVDGLAIIELMGVLPSRMRAGVGRALVEASCDWARAGGYPAIIVNAYAEVPWMVAFFAACGFTETDEVGPELAELIDWETAIGLDRLGRRTTLRRDL